MRDSIMAAVCGDHAGLTGSFSNAFLYAASHVGSVFERSSSFAGSEASVPATATASETLGPASSPLCLSTATRSPLIDKSNPVSVSAAGVLDAASGTLTNQSLAKPRITAPQMATTTPTPSFVIEPCLEKTISCHDRLHIPIVLFNKPFPRQCGSAKFGGLARESERLY